MLTALAMSRVNIELFLAYAERANKRQDADSTLLVAPKMHERKYMQRALVPQTGACGAATPHAQKKNDLRGEAWQGPAEASKFFI